MHAGFCFCALHALLPKACQDNCRHLLQQSCVRLYVARRLPAALITSSGTAVANLLPAVVEASQSNIPMLLITADRPSEMRDTGANQTIDQVKIFGGYTRWAIDVAPPDHEVPVRGLLTSADAAVRFATGTPAGPVHINCQFREPLAPAAADWPPSLLKVGQLQRPSVIPHLTQSCLWLHLGPCVALRSTDMTVQDHWLGVFLLCTFVVLSCAGAHCCVKSGMFDESIYLCRA